MADEEGSGGPLFGDVVFTVMPGEQIDPAEIRKALTTAGAQYVPLGEDDQVENLGELTHIVSEHVDFRQYERAIELCISVVKPTWIVQSINRNKQASTRQHSPDPSQFLHEVVVTCADVPENDEEAIIGGVIAMGGQYTRSLSKLVTHMVTMSMDHPKVDLAEDKGVRCKVVLPHWFTDCFTLGKKINERPYLFPDPEYLKKTNTTSVRPTSSPYLDGAVTASPSKHTLLNPPPSPSKNRKNFNAFMSKTIFLSDDLKLPENIHSMLEKLIDHGGGVITHNVEKADIYIGQWRDGEDYVTSSRAGKEVANLAWLYHVINGNKYTSPLRRLFHYPMPRDGVLGFEQMKISLSNYSGEARTYVENLIRACGGQYTKTMKQDNTHLITAHMHGEKCDAAAEWNIHIVNHIWLEESFAKCAIQSMSVPKYVHFPTRTNLGEVTGQASLDMRCVERRYFPKPRSPQKGRPAHKASSKAVPVSSAIDNAAEMQDDTNMDGPITNTEVDEMNVDADAAPQTSKKPRGRPAKSAVATPRTVSNADDSPSVTSTGRASKTKALGFIHGQAADITLFQKEMKRKGGVTHGGRHSDLAEDMSPEPPRRSRKRPSDEFEATTMDGDLSDGETQDRPVKQPTKKAKQGSSTALPPIEYRMMVTGDDRWKENSRKESTDRVTLRSLGVLLTNDPKDVDILVAPKMLRTRKFVSALACAPLVVSTSFLDTALNKKKLIEDPPMLKDRDSEERLGFTLEDAIERAKYNKRKLFRHWPIFVTEEINGGFDTYKDIIGLNGGSAMLYKGRLGVSVTKQATGDDDDTESSVNDDDYLYLVSGTSDKEAKLWKPFRENAAKQGLKVRVVTSDWVLNAAMSQQIVLDEKWLLMEDETVSQRIGQ